MTTAERDKRLKYADTVYKNDDAQSFITSVGNNPSRIGTPPHIEAMDTLWGKGKDEGKEGTLSYQYATAPDQGAFLADMANKFNGLPDGAKKAIESGLSVGSADQKANILRGLVSIKQDNPYANNILGSLPQKTQDAAGLMETLTAAGIPAQEAAINTFQTLNPTEAVDKQREKDYQKLNVTDNKMLPFDKYEQDQWKPWLGGNAVADQATPDSANYNQTQRDALAADYNSLFHANFMRTGSAALAADQAHKSIAERYAPSVANGGYLMKDAPEAIYGVSGADVKDYMTKAGIKDDQQLFPMRDKGNNVTYLIRDKDGNPQFDPKTGKIDTLTFNKDKLQEAARSELRTLGQAPEKRRIDPNAPSFINAKIGM